MESPGEYLKRERELRGASLAKIFEVTRVPRNCLAALEDDDYEHLPHATFVKGYIRSYCKFLGLDETDVLLRYELYLKEEGGKTQSVDHTLSITHADDEPHRPESASTRNTYVLIGIGVLILIVFYVVSSMRGAPERSSQRPQVAETTEAAEAPQAAEVRVESAVPEEPIDEVVRQARLEAMLGESVSAPVDPVPIKPTPLAEANHTLVVVASEIVWIEVTIDGREPFEVVLQEGEKVVWKAEDGISLVVGNAGGVSLSFDGRDLGVIGASGKVARLELGTPATAEGRETEKVEPAGAAPSEARPATTDNEG